VSQNAPEPTAVSPTSQPGTPSRIYSTNQNSTTLSNPSDTTALNVNVQGVTEMDKNLGQKIMQELQTDAALAGQISGITLNADNGKIMLRGTVKSEDQKKSIETAVQRVAGVTSVENNIRVGSNPTSTTGDVEPK
jgi:osmotically-inducible protein OsmY